MQWRTWTTPLSHISMMLKWCVLLFAGLHYCLGEDGSLLLLFILPKIVRVLCLRSIQRLLSAIDQLMRNRIAECSALNISLDVSSGDFTLLSMAVCIELFE